jgi:membrane protease YdiL (CAAX protease family)
MKSVLEFFAVFTIAILPQILSSVFSVSNKEFLKRFTGRQRILVNLSSFSGMILLAAYVAMSHPEGWAYIGLRFNEESLPRIIIVTSAATFYLLLIFIIAKFRSQKERQKIEQRKNDIFEAGRWTDLKSFWERAAYLPTLWIGILAEDLIFRGYLIFGLRAQTGLLLPWIILSVSFSILVHLYQGTGWRILLGQGIFAIIFITVSLLAQNIIAAIIPHLVYDTIWMLQGWANMPKKEPQPNESVS